MKTIAELITLIALVVPWLIGLAIAKGFLQTLFAVFPPYAWYLVVEKILINYGII